MLASRALLAAHLFIAFSFIASAAPPTLVVPEKVYGEEGDWVWFKVQTDSKWVEYGGVDTLQFFPSSKLKDPTEVGVLGKAGTYTITVLVGNAEAPNKAKITVVIVRKSPIIPPGPTPGPTPPTPLPDGDLGLIKVSRDALAKTPNPVRRAELQKAQLAHASKVAAGGFPNAAAILNGWRTANGEAVNTPAEPKANENWKVWAEATSSGLQTLYNSGKLKTNADWRNAFTEIGAGLEAP